MPNRSKLLKLTIINVGCIGPDGAEIALDDVVCLVGKNNAGKSTILRAYELAVSPNLFNVESDRCDWAPADQPSVVELDVHIPEGTGNVDEKWKQAEGDLLVVRSRWEWSPEGEVSRTTWDPVEGEWSTSAKAGGADNVFKSRLPRPLRIGSLEDAAKTEEVLLTLALTPFTTQMKELQDDPASELSISVTALRELVGDFSKAHEDRFAEIAESVHEGFSGVFPGLGIKLDVGMAAPKIDLAKLLEAGSGLRVQDGVNEATVAQQGTGARRALFWSMLQVHNQLKRNMDLVAGLKKELAKAKTDEKKAELAQKIETLEAGKPLEQDDSDPAFPGYLLLIDEPENALHPLAARAAQRHLYRLATDPDWQVMMTTHSPYFVNPFEDHTTIVRLERGNGEGSPLTRKTYRADEVEFDPDTKRNLNALQSMDIGFSEVFFGSYPILVEGDTEHAAFLAAVVEDGHELADKLAIVRARGKAILPGLMRMLRHFKVSFGVMHDVDWPFTRKGGASAMWTINKTIFEEAEACRDEGVDVRHRVSLPDFERLLGGDELGKDKPLSAYLRVAGAEAEKEQVRMLLGDLLEGDNPLPLEFEKTDDDSYLKALNAALADWCKENGGADDIRLTGLAA